MLPFRNLVRRSLSCSTTVLRKCKPPKATGGDCECQKAKEPCEAVRPKKPKKVDRQCETTPEDGPHGAPAKDMGLPEYCSKENALECARKLQELQKQWEAVAAACDPGERAAPKKRPGCPVQPPEREDGGVSPVVVLLAGAALIAAIVWWVINNKDELEKRDGDGENKEGGDKKA